MNYLENGLKSYRELNDMKLTNANTVWTDEVSRAVDNNHVGTSSQGKEYGEMIPKQFRKVDALRSGRGEAAEHGRYQEVKKWLSDPNLTK